MEPSVNEAIDFAIQNDPRFKERFSYIVGYYQGEVSTIQLVQEFKAYFQEMIDQGSMTLDEDLGIHLSVFIMTSGYPINLNGKPGFIS